MKRKDIMDFIEQLPFVTTQMSVTTYAGLLSSGTGFFFAFDYNKGTEKECYTPLLITNRHVLEDASYVEIKITRGAGGKPSVGDTLSLSFDHAERLTIFHPNPSVDLAAIMIGPIMQKYHESLFVPYLSPTEIANEDEMKDINVMHDVIMIGYPDGISDTTNHMPIFRKGITATRPDLDYNGEKVFLIDASCFPGSSGSPIIAYDNGAILSSSGIVSFGRKMRLIGIQSKVFLHDSNGNIVPMKVPTQTSLGVVTQIPNNIGIAVKASCIMDFEPLIPFVPR